MRGQTNILLRLDDSDRPQWLLCLVADGIVHIEESMWATPAGEVDPDERLRRDDVLEWVRRKIHTNVVSLQPMVDADCPSWWVHCTSPNFDRV